ncbi:methylated-DNA--[protein]-cysteine S-methyltransferase [Alcaligenaceae bacterium 429]|uniref:methylated-DNA--[protein]-cysteine S-methyltransferase n=1 Tax=Paenalcaligenes sp. Me52 TaxID=3392038 RepID=UPI001092C42C|nr:methylated-DNA--[protein]-cysteine S-methyltransferase [Alcaligenaceae bacterium 429]
MPTLFLLERAPTPLGEMLVVTDEQGKLRALDWEDYAQRLHTLMQRQYKGQAYTVKNTDQRSTATQAVLRYFDGDMQAIEQLATSTGGTDFQRQVWQTLLTIPCGQTISYGELAERIHNPKAVRAVGLANGANPISIVIPCHRVIGSNQRLTGYGGGLPRKLWLLQHERAHTQQETECGQLPLVLR